MVSLQTLSNVYSNRFQRNHMNGSFSNKKKTSAGVPQGSLLSPLLLNIFLNDIFLFINNTFLCNYADDNTLYNEGKNLDKLKLDLLSNYSILVK